MSGELEKLNQSFHKMKNTLYTTTYDVKKYKYTDIATLVAKKEKNEDDLIFLKKLYHYFESMKNVVEDLGTEIIKLKEVDFENKNEVEVYSREIIELIDKFIDTLVAINSNFQLSSDDVNTRMSEFHLKSLRSKFIKAVNTFKMKFDVNMDSTERVKIYTFITDIIDDIIKESISLRVVRLYEVLDKQLNQNQ